MTLNGWLQILLFFSIILAVTKPLGLFMTHVFNREKTFLDPMLRPIERLIYRLTRVNEEREMKWTEYAISMLLFSGVSMLALYLMQRLQRVLPFNPQQLPGVDSTSFTGSSFNTEYKLAVVCARNNHELLHSDGRAHIPQFCIGRSRHFSSHCLYTRYCT